MNSMSVICALGGSGIKKKKAMTNNADMKAKWKMYEPLVASGSSITESAYSAFLRLNKALS